MTRRVRFGLIGLVCLLALATVGATPIGEDQDAAALQKLATARAIIGAVKSLSPATDLSASLTAEYFDAGTFTDADVASLGIDAAALASCITLLQQVDKLMTNQATTVAMHRATLNRVRRVQTAVGPPF